MGATSALTRRALADSRSRNLSFALLFGAISAVQVVGYRSSYPTRADRLAFARSFGDNAAVRLFYGAPHDLLTVGGYAAWRVGGVLSLFAAVWGLLAAVRALRGEEDTGRLELILATPVGRRRVFASALAAIGIGAALLFSAAFAGLTLTRLPAGGAAYLALATVSPAFVFAGVGALASQIAANRRLALGISIAVLAVAFALRVIADTVSGAGWLRFATPLGWVEELRPFADPRPAVLVLPLLAGAGLLALSMPIAMRRDSGAGLLHSTDSAEPRGFLLSSPIALALRSELAALVAWIGGLGLFAMIIGIISDSVASGLSQNLKDEIGKLGAGSLLTASGALSFYFLFFLLVVSLFAAAQIVTARREEAEQRLETLLSLPVSRRRWLTGRLLLAVAGMLALVLTAALLSFAGAASQGADVALVQMLGAGANCLPAALLFLGLATLGFAVLPRQSSLIAYGVVLVSFLWELVGSLLKAPGWTLGLSAFHHVGLVPAHAFRPAAALAMLAIGVLAAVVAVAVFERRDLSGA
jgi:ABC-2 type transport system permease protein